MKNCNICERIAIKNMEQDVHYFSKLSNTNQISVLLLCSETTHNRPQQPASPLLCDMTTSAALQPQNTSLISPHAPIPAKKTLIKIHLKMFSPSSPSSATDIYALPPALRSDVAVASADDEVDAAAAASNTLLLPIVSIITPIHLQK